MVTMFSVNHFIWSFFFFSFFLGIYVLYSVRRHVYNTCFQLSAFGNGLYKSLYLSLVILSYQFYQAFLINHLHVHFFLFPCLISSSYVAFISSI